MQFKMFSFLSPLILAMALFGGCAKTNYDGSTRVKPFSNPNPEPTPTARLREQPTPTTPAPTPPTAAANLPVVSFVQTEVQMDRKLEAHLELQLSEISSLPVTVVVNLVDASARHYRDFAGFKTRTSETSQTIVIPPGSTRMPLPVIGGRRTRFCDSYFNAVIKASRLQNASVSEGTARVILPCENVAPADDQTGQPALRPCDIIARFESEIIVNREHAKQAHVRIVLDQPVEWPVIIDLETRDRSAFAGIDYLQTKVKLTIPAGQTAVDLPIELIKNQRCRTPEMHRWQQHANFDFNVVVTGITNADILKPTALIILKKDVDDEKCQPAPQVN